MKRALILFFAAILISYPLSFASGYILNDYFGVELSVNSSGAFNMPWSPIRGTGMHENWRTDGDEHAPDPGPRYYLSEVFDIEAMYMDFDWASDQLVFSIVTSMPNTGFNQVSWYPGYLFRAGDIRFNVGMDTYVLGTYGGFYGNLYHNPTMTYTDGHRGFAERGNPLLAPSNLGHQMSTSNLEFNYGQYFDNNGDPMIENGYATYVMEGRISLADLGADPAGSPVNMTLAMSCNNDVATLTSVPEPGTMALMGLGLLGLYGVKRRFRI